MDYDLNWILIVLAKLVLANNRLVEDIQTKDGQIAILQRQLEEKEKRDGLESADTH